MNRGCLLLAAALRASGLAPAADGLAIAVDRSYGEVPAGAPAPAGVQSHEGS